jgi:hypothetical protein
MKLAVLQSNYIPWIGYFDLISSVDQVVILDSVQYTKNDWRNRNILIGPNGPFWLTIPILRPYGLATAIDETLIANDSWARRHSKSVDQVLSRRPHWSIYQEMFHDAYLSVEGIRSLSEVNLSFMRLILNCFGVSTDWISDRSLQVDETNPTLRLIRICRAIGADEYVTGPAGMNYMDTDAFKQHGIRLNIFRYPSYGPYPQSLDSFTPKVSVLDFLANNSFNFVQELLDKQHK